MSDYNSTAGSAGKQDDRTPKANSPETTPDEQHPEPGATEEALALHGDKAREERYDQPEAVTLDSSTRIATAEPNDDEGR